MAKKNKDDIDDNDDDFNEGNSEDINDADDNFGLPDVEYSPVNRDEEKEQPAPDEQDRTEQTPFASLHKRDIIYSSISKEANSSSGDSGYQPPKKESNAPKILILLAVLLMVAVGIWYFGIYKPEQDRLQAQQEQELREEQARAERERQAQIERERQEREEAEREAARVAAEAEAAASESNSGSFETIPNRTGRYYVVVASAIDMDLATDYAKKLAQEGKNAKILAPKGNNKFHRVAVGDYENLAGAQEDLSDFRSRYGNEVWVVKF